MKTRLLKIGMLIAGLMFVFTATSWADSGRKGYRPGAEKRIYAKHHDGGFYQQPARHHDKRKIKRIHKFYHRKKWVNKHRQYRRNKWIRMHRLHQRNKWIRKHHRHYSDTSYDDDTAYNEFSVAATFSEPGVEFSIGTKRTW